MSFAKEEKRPMEKGTDGKMKSVASIPDNYVSILQLQERWMKEKEQKHKETDIGVKQEVNGQRRREEEPRVKIEGKKIWNKGPNCVEKEAEASTVVSKKEENVRKKKWSKQKNQGGSVKEVFKSGSKAYVPREANPVKEEIPGEKTVQNKESTAASYLIALETQFQHLRIKKSVVEEDREVKGPARLNSGPGYYRNQKRETGTMVWVKKGENNGASGGNGFNF